MATRGCRRTGLVLAAAVLASAGCAVVDQLRPEIRPLVDVEADLPTGVVTEDEDRDRLVAAMPAATADVVAAVSMDEELLIVIGYDGCGLENPRLRWRGDDHLYSDYDSTGINCFVPVPASAVFAIERGELPDRVTYGSRTPSVTDTVIEDQGARVVTPRVFSTTRLVRQRDPDAPELALFAAATTAEIDRLIDENFLPREHVDTGPRDALFVVRHHACPFIYRLVLDEDNGRLFVHTDRGPDSDDCTQDTVEVAAFVVRVTNLPSPLTFGVGPDPDSRDLTITLP